MKVKVLIFSVAIMLTLTLSVAAQESQKPNSTPPPTQTDQIQADETFELDISERHITQTNYENSTSLSIGSQDARDVRLQIGVALWAQSIDVMLRNVKGSVRFRGSLTRILDLVNSRAPR